MVEFVELMNHWKWAWGFFVSSTVDGEFGLKRLRDRFLPLLPSSCALGFALSFAFSRLERASTSCLAHKLEWIDGRGHFQHLPGGD
jgi:hypothetical protein